MGVSALGNGILVHLVVRSAIVGTQPQPHGSFLRREQLDAIALSFMVIPMALRSHQYRCGIDQTSRSVVLAGENVFVLSL